MRNPHPQHSAPYHDYRAGYAAGIAEHDGHPVASSPSAAHQQGRQDARDMLSGKAFRIAQPSETALVADILYHHLVYHEDGTVYVEHADQLSPAPAPPMIDLPPGYLRRVLEHHALAPGPDDDDAVRVCACGWQDTQRRYSWHIAQELSTWNCS